MTTTPSIETVCSITRIASTAAWSARSFCPRPIHRPAAMAPASVTRTSSRARFRSGASLGGAGIGSAGSAASLIVRSPLQTVEEAAGGGLLEQDPVHLREEGEAAD